MFVPRGCRNLSEATGPVSGVDEAALGMNEQSSSLRNELELVTGAELCRHLKVCRRQLYSWRTAGLIPYFKIGKAVRFRVADVAEALDRLRIG
jgi:hypothetical protein